jgi:Uma2 family endonuclease
MDRSGDMQPARADRIRLTYEDLLGFPDDGRRHELIDGEHYVTPAPTPRHQELSGRLHLALGTYLRGSPIGKLYYAPVDVFLSNHDVVEPDLLFVSSARLGIIGKLVRGAPDLAVEILSPSTRRTDEVTKRRLFDRSGVGEYWVVDPEIEVVKVYRRSEGGVFARAEELRREAGDVLATPLFPGFSLALEELFE